MFNERIKLSATALNALGIALVGAAFVFPIVRDQNVGALLELVTWAWIVLGGGPHGLGWGLLGLLRQED